ncbi:hypothetical protein DFQ28_003940 [Apophysomyces sp. BC1034]|nr:hypothetical protein DFQ30_003895 [Apophysomyces sp. BC1015]KAG0178692.1 hypothetical protein DFQ29_003112 [Apophysomyces sp. BC1021]KAG0189066.1 hypothetical protein DFQ28_003940 [Apophysomyces sp. BC1034]
MGAQQSKSSEPVIFYNQNVPLQFSQGLVDSLETRTKTASSSESSNARPEEVEHIVRQRVAEELQRAQEQQEEINKQIYGDIAKRNIDNDHNSVAMGADIDNMIQRIQRSSAKEIPAEIAERQEAVVACYRKNESRPLDCWEEVEQFKESVAKAQKKFIAAYQ